ncbi:hypothetical protein A2U01_0006085, partial [Trifolium medium]|nr:hypothetical protein [Trifolium medium]
FAMTGVKGQKIIIRQQQRPTFSCTYHRNLRSRANRALVRLEEGRGRCSPISLWGVHTLKILSTDA